MKEPVSADYWPSDKPLSDSLSCISFCVASDSPLCPNQALLGENALLYALGKNSEGWCFRFLHHKHFHLHSQGVNRCPPLKKCCFLLLVRSGEITEGKEVCDWTEQVQQSPRLGTFCNMFFLGSGPEGFLLMTMNWRRWSSLCWAE